MKLSLEQLIKEAKTFGSVACSEGIHQWVTDGGRGCPKYAYGHCSQAVYMCSVCGEYDYGDKGGPGWNDCFNHCTEIDMSDIYGNQ